MAKEYDPLSVIPSVEVIRERLQKAESDVRRFRVLLRTAEQIEAGGIDASDGVQIPGTAEIRAEMQANSERNRLLRSLYRVARNAERLSKAAST